MFAVLATVALSIAACSAPAATRSTAPTPTSTPVGTPTSPTTATSTSTTTAPAGLSLLVEPQAGMGALYGFMSAARQSLDMTMYELSDAAAEQILIADHQRGVRVRVLLDEDYSGKSVNQPAYSTLSSAGVSVAWTNDSEIFHQKTITVDGDASAVMTGNLTAKYYASTRDFVVMDSEAADVAAIESAFAKDWSGAAPSTGQQGADLVWSPGAQPPLVALINAAARSVVVENEEMHSSPIEVALQSDARRGIDVTVVMTADAEWDAALAQLASAGVHVVLYPDTSSALYIHAKVIDVDSAKAFIGSENFSTASLDDNRELGLITASPSVLAPLNATLSDDISNGQAQQGASTPAATAPSTSPTSALPSTVPASCSPIDNEGGCYEPGEYCRKNDHGMTGRGGDGKVITCELRGSDWYWEAA